LSKALDYQSQNDSADLNLIRIRREKVEKKDRKNGVAMSRGIQTSWKTNASRSEREKKGKREEVKKRREERWKKERRRN